MTEDIQDALAELEDQTCVWNGATYPCQFGDARKQGALEEGGFAMSADLQIVLTVNQFTANGTTARPQRGQTITADGKRYRIETATTTPLGALVLDCASDAKGA